MQLWQARASTKRFVCTGKGGKTFHVRPFAADMEDYGSMLQIVTDCYSMFMYFLDKFLPDPSCLCTHDKNLICKLTTDLDAEWCRMMRIDSRHLTPQICHVWCGRKMAEDSQCWKTSCSAHSRSSSKCICRASSSSSISSLAQDYQMFDMFVFSYIFYYSLRVMSKARGTPRNLVNMITSSRTWPSRRQASKSV